MQNNFQRKYGFNVYNKKPEELFLYASSTGLHHIEINLSHEEFSIETYDSDRIMKLRELSKEHQ